MKLSSSIINHLRYAPSVQGRIRPSHELVSLAEETVTGSPLDHVSGIHQFQHGSFEWLPSHDPNDSSTDHEEAFYDAFEQAQDAHLTIEEKEKYLKSVLNLDMSPTENSNYVYTDGDAHHSTYFVAHEKPWKKVTRRHSFMHAQAEPGCPRANGSLAGRNWQTHPGLYGASLFKKNPRSVPSPCGNGKGQLAPTTINKKVHEEKPTKDKKKIIKDKAYETGYREKDMPSYLIKELDLLDTKEFESALDYWMNQHNFIGSNDSICAYDESIYPNPKNKKFKNYQKGSPNLPNNRGKALSFACKVLIEYSQHQRLQSLTPPIRRL
jgi:hypothetical protein